MKLLNVTDLSSYLYCPRKYFLTKIKGIREPTTKPMIEGSLRHKVLESFSNQEELFVSSLNNQNKPEIINKFNLFLQNTIDNIFSKNLFMIQKFSIQLKELREKISESMKNDIELRADSIETAIKKGFSGKSLWDNLSPKYLSEFKFESENLGLVGKADRIMISKETNEIIPFELKTRQADKIWPSDEIQLTAYAMLSEEHFNKPILHAVLEAGNIKHKLFITEEMKQKVIDLILEIRSLTTSAKYPSSFAKCQACSLKSYCDEMG